MRVSRSFALAVATGAIVFGSAGLANADQDVRAHSGGPRGDDVLVENHEHAHPGDRRDDGGEAGGGQGLDGRGDGASGEDSEERRRGENDQQPCEGEPIYRGEIVPDPGDVRTGQEDSGEADRNLGEGGSGGPPGRTDCSDPPAAPATPGKPLRAEPSTQVHTDPGGDDSADDPRSRSGAGSDIERTTPRVSRSGAETGEVRSDGTSASETGAPTVGQPVSRGASASAPVASVQRADAGSDDDDGAAAAGDGGDGGIGIGGGVLLIGGGGLVAAAAAAVLAARTRRV